MTKTATRPLSWKPKLDGDVYCAPACGSKCKLAAHELAKERGETLRQRLGPGWVVRVWENMGWHYEVHTTCGCLRVSEHWRRPHDNDTVVDKVAAVLPEDYTVFLNTHGRSGGRWTAQSETPEEGIREVVAAMRVECDLLASVLLRLEPISAR